MKEKHSDIHTRYVTSVYLKFMPFLKFYLEAASADKRASEIHPPKLTFCSNKMIEEGGQVVSKSNKFLKQMKLD